MAGYQSSPLCAPLGFLLLLVGVISFHIYKVQAGPIDFWCKCQARKNMEKRTDGLQKEMANCVGSGTLSSPVQLPCVLVNTSEWALKTLNNSFLAPTLGPVPNVITCYYLLDYLQQKHAEVFGDLLGFQDTVQGARNQTTPCQMSVLERLQHLITNYLLIVRKLPIQNDLAMPPHSEVQNCSSQTTLSKVLPQFKNLLTGKMKRLAVDLHESICKTTGGTTESERPCG
ncbi:uncharacterized protein V6R79_021505 [Siganus canaliculatus]